MIQAYGKTDIGKKRRLNQDYIYLGDPLSGTPLLYILADGMGGHRAGDYASRLLVETLAEYVRRTGSACPARDLEGGIIQANRLVYEKSLSEPELTGMGSTVVAVIAENNLLTAANVGDSRLYTIGNRITQITRDHSYVEEMAALGLMERGSEEYQSQKNIITRAVGIEKNIRIDFFETELNEGDYFLLCSDGLSNMLSNSEIADVVRGAGTLRDKADLLVKKANDNGGTDNISVILGQYRKDGSCDD